MKTEKRRKRYMTHFVKITLEHRLARKIEMICRPEVEVLIQENSQDVLRIEQMLDKMLDFCFDSRMLILYKKLCRHYYRIDPQATASYIYACREMWAQNE
jgi:hypothetical protein